MLFYHLYKLNSPSSSQINNGNKLFYRRAKEYWNKVPPTVNGVLHGFGYTNNIDIKGSRKFLETVFQQRNPPKRNRALDCGAGIGRVTKELLINYFDKVDLVDQNERFLMKARDSIGNAENLGLLYIRTLQDFIPEYKYDLIWCQWVLSHLVDKDFVKFLKNCRKSLNENGVIIVKDNVSNKYPELDRMDSSITRPLETMNLFFDKAGLQPFNIQTQTGFPENVYTVKIIALRPKVVPQPTKGTNSGMTSIPKLYVQCKKIFSKN